MAKSNDQGDLIPPEKITIPKAALPDRQPAASALNDAQDALKSRTAELAQSLMLMQAALDATDDAILVTDVEGNVTHLNQQFVQMWRLPQEALALKQHLKLGEYSARQYPSPASFLNRVRDIYESEQEAYDELQLVDGRIVERYSKIQFVDTRPIGRVWSYRDITDRKRAEELQLRLAAIVESSDDAIVSKTLDGIITTWNSGAARMFGYTAEEIVGKHVTTLFPPDRLSEEAMILERLRRGERIRHYESVRVRKDGTPINVSLTVSPITDASGRVIGASKIARDITERKAAEQLSSRLAAIVESSDDAIISKTLEGVITTWNFGAQRTFGYTADEAVGQPITMLIPADRLHEEVLILGRIRRGERVQHYETQRMRKDGTLIDVSLTVSPIKDADGDIIGASKIARDITDSKQAEQEREQLLKSERAARSDAERASLLKDEFLATLSHELRTPLNAILGWSQLLSSGNVDEADLKQGLEVIQRNARTQTQLIEDLLDMSRIVSGKVRLDVQWTDLATVVDAAVDSVRPSADAKGIRLRKILDPHAGPVAGDPTRLQQVVWNLLSNAIKFTPKGGKVDVLLERVNSHLEITVHDSGIGIKPEFLPIIFERFRQADSSTTRSFGGLGLGLSIVKSLVELHGGTVRAKSEGAGATFVVSLPLAPVRSSEKREHPTTPKAPSVEHLQLDLSGIKVLVVDDEPDARSLISRLLTQCNAEVSTAASAVEGMDQLEKFKPHVLVSDIGMPQTDGYQFIRDVRNLPSDRGGKTPAIALTAFARSEDRTRAMMAGFQVHVAKPIEPQELAVTVGSLAGRMATMKN